MADCADINARYMPENKFLDATITITPATPAGFDKEDLKDYKHSYVVQGTYDAAYPTPPYTAVPDIAITGDWTTFKRVSGINVKWSNLTAGATVRLQYWNEAGQTGTLIYDSGATEALQYKTFEELDWLIDNIVAIKEYGSIGRNSFWYHDVQIALSFKITISNATNENGFIELNDVFLGEWMTTDTNVQYGSQWGIVDTSEQKLMDDGTTSSVAGIESDFMSLEYNSLSDDDRTVLNDKIIRPNGKHTPFWCDVYPNEIGTSKNQHHVGMFLLVNEPSLGYETGNLTSVSFELRRK